MWRNKKLDTPQGADPEPKNLQTNQPPKPAPGSWEGITRTGKDAVGPTGAMAGRDCTAWIEPECERGNLGRRGPAH
jgi:hypothetical protein